MIKNIFKQLLKISTILTIFLGFTSQAMADENPYDLMHKLSHDLFSTIKKDQAKINKNPNYLKQIVKQDLIPYVHVKYAASTVLGRYYAKSTLAQRNEFFKAFEGFIIQSYAQVLTLYTDQKIQIEAKKDVGKKNFVSIRVNIIQSSAPAVKLDFKWRKNTKSGKWQAYDMAAEGVSMLVTKQNEWAGILRTQGIEVLTKKVLAQADLPIEIKK